jgi:hypothetical protein
VRDNRLEVRIAYVVGGMDRVVEAIALPVFGHSGMGDVVHEAFKECRQVLERAIMADNARTFTHTSTGESDG